MSMDCVERREASNESIAARTALTNAMAAHAVVPGRVSVIVAVYQGERFIVGAIRSALGQTYRDIEVLVVDDGSTDRTAALVEAIGDDRVKLFRQPNGGAASARNLALTHASGEYIASLDADDRWLPRKLEIEIATLKAADDPIGIAYSWYYAVDRDGNLLNKSRGQTFSGDVFDTMIREEFDIMTSISFFHRRVFETLGGFDAARRLHEDGAFMLRATRAFPVYPTSQYLVVYQQTTEGKCRKALADFKTARDAQLSIVEDLRSQLSDEQYRVFRERQIRALYFRFLMYGYGKSASLMLPDIDVRSLKHGAKGWIAWIHAKSGINLMHPIRLAVQGASRSFGQGTWHKQLSREGLELGYESGP